MNKSLFSQPSKVADITCQIVRPFYFNEEEDARKKVT